MNERDQLDIMHCVYLKQPYFRAHPAYIYGIAGSYGEALDIVIRISDEAVRNGQDGMLVRYLDGKNFQQYNKKF